MDLELKDRIVLVTGSARGAGQAMAVLFGCEGARVVVNYHSSAGPAEETAQAVRDAGGQALIVQADVAERASMGRLVEQVRAAWGPIQVLVNNASLYADETELDQVTDETLARVWDVVVRGAVVAGAACVPGMREAGWGRIVNITSRSGIMGSPRNTHYAAAKSALVGITRSWAKELGPAGILVNAVAPTMIMTDRMLASMPEKAQERAAGNNPTRRLAMPDDIARVVLFLASGWNSYVNGEIITVGGGVQS